MSEKEPITTSYSISIEARSATKWAITLIEDIWEEKKGLAVISYKKERDKLILEITSYEIKRVVPFLIKLLDESNLRDIFVKLQNNQSIPSYFTELATEIWKSLIKIISTQSYDGLRVILTSTSFKIEKITPSSRPRSYLPNIIKQISSLIARAISPNSNSPQIDNADEDIQQKLQKLLQQLREIDPSLAQKYEDFINQLLIPHGK